MFAHDITGRIPNREQDTLALMVTCPVGVRLAEISERDDSSTAERISDRRISAGLRARTQPPTPRLERTIPAPLSASKIARDMAEGCRPLGNVSNRVGPESSAREQGRATPDRHSHPLLKPARPHSRRRVEPWPCSTAGRQFEHLAIELTLTICADGLSG